MQSPDDNVLLRQFAESESNEAFAGLVTRHINLVYSVALRQTGNAHNAEEITQAVFIILAKKAAQLRHDRALSSWLFQTTRLTANNFIRSESRRHRREEEAFMQTVLYAAGTEAWPQIAPLLDAAVAGLREQDRQAILLRFYERRNLGDIGLTLGVSEDAAEKRVNRALEKLRKFFTKRGISSTTAMLAGAVSAQSVQAAPAGLKKAVTAIAIAKGAAAGTSTLTLVKGALKMMAWTKMKTAVVVGAGVLLAAGTATVLAEKNAQPKLVWTNPAWADDPKYWSSDPRVLANNPKALIFRPTQFPNDEAVMTACGKSAGPNRFMAKNERLSRILARAYNAWSSRVILPSDISTARFDMMITLVSQPIQARDIYQQMLKERFGFVGHRETRDVDVFGFKVAKTPAKGLSISTGGKFYRKIGNSEIVLHNLYLHEFCFQLEEQLGEPVIDNSDLTKAGVHYDIDLRWQTQPNQTKEQAIKQALLDQLGLELVPRREPIEMLVVEKVK